MTDRRMYIQALREALDLARSVGNAEKLSSGRRMGRGWEARVIGAHLQDWIDRYDDCDRLHPGQWQWSGCHVTHNDSPDYIGYMIVCPRPTNTCTAEQAIEAAR